MAELIQTEQEDLQEILQALERDGGVIVRNYIDAPLCSRLRKDFTRGIEEEPWCNTDGPGEDEFFGLMSKRLHGLLRHSTAAAATLTHPLACAIAGQLHGSGFTASTGELMAIGPAEIKQSFHRDGDSWHRAELDRELLISVNIALTPFTRDNGATVLIPGSHKWPHGRKPVAEDVAYAQMPAGAALIYSGRIFHSGGANTTADIRMGLYWGYIPGWLRPLEDFTVTLGEALLRDQNPEVQALLGYSTSGFQTVF